MRMIGPPLTRAGRRREQGLTLLEILVAIAILVFGIYAVIRIFPPGLDLIQEGSRKTLATRVAESLAEQARGDELALPEAITGGDPLLSSREVAEFARQQRRIVGETALLPAAVAGGSVAGYSPYLLEHGPVDPADPFEVISGLYRKVPLDDLAIDGFDHQQYAVPDARHGVLAFDVVPHDRLLAVRYTWMDSGGSFHVEVEDLLLPAEEREVQVGAAGQLLFAGLVDNSESLFRRYELEGLVGAPASPSAPGMYLLNPEGGTLFAHPADAGQGVRISYTTLNWQIVREETTVVDDNGAAVAQLGFEWVADPGNPDDPSNPPVQVLLVETATGAILQPADIDYRSGAIFLSPSAVGKTVRAYYQTLDDWGVQWIPAASLYEPGLDLLDEPGEAFHRFALAVDPGSGQAALGFAPSESGRGVRVSYQAWDAVAGRASQVSGELHTIPFGPPDPAAGLDPSLRWMLLSQPIVHDNGEPRQLTVQGASLKLRVLWRDNDGDLQHLDVDTYVRR